jgi:hypothetical protein
MVLRIYTVGGAPEARPVHHTSKSGAAKKPVSTTQAKN